MKNISVFLLFIASITGCKQSPVRQSFSPADSLVIHFKDELVGVVKKTLETTEWKAINRVIEFMDAKETGQFKCVYDGKMFFYKEGKQIQEVDFKMRNDSCNHFAFLLDGKLIRTKMSHEAVDFFDAIERGVSYY
jgi:hypothetical protein